jgi:hypothetical protein
MLTRPEKDAEIRRKPLLRWEALWAGLLLALILNAIFYPAIWGGKTLLSSAWSTASIMPSGAYHPGPTPIHVSPTPDPGAPGWTLEPWIKTIAQQYWKEHHAPLWNPFNAYGTPLAAAMQPQPFYPLTALLSLCPTPWTYNLFVIARLFLAGFLTFLFARLFLAYTASLFAAITFMLSGYFILYLNMPHLSVEVLLPAIFLTFELLLRKGTWRAVGAAAAAIFLCITGGMPESSFLAISFGCVFFFYRLILAPEFNGQRFQLVGKFVAALLVGFGLSGFLLAPFIELMQRAHDVHQAINLHGDVSGLVADSTWLFTVTYLLPNLAGPLLTAIFGNPFGGMQSYWGLLPVLFSMAAVLGLFTESKSFSANPRTALTLFFLLSLIFFLLKRFGNPLVNWIGRLPLADLVFFPKYQEPLMAFSVAMLGAIGFSLALKASVGGRCFFAAAVTVICLLIGMGVWYWPLVYVHEDVTLRFLQVLTTGAIFVLASVFLFALFRQHRRGNWLPWSLLAILSAELFFSFIYPNFYLNNALPSAKSYNPYAGAPYVEFLQQRQKDRYRMFALDGILYPNWAAAFDLMDVRNLDAMYYRRYIAFIRNFLLRPGDEARRHGELADRFVGIGDGYSYRFESELERRFLTLSSIRYVINAVELSTNAIAAGEDTEHPGHASFRQIYNKEVHISEFQDPLPRASLFHAVEILPDERVLGRLKDRTFDASQRVLISAQSLPPDMIGSIDQFVQGSLAPVTAATIVDYDSQHVQIETRSDTPAILMLNDANYPGWHATLNGRPVPILQADYLFQAVIVPAGRATVEFTYAPLSFRAGALISLASLIALVVPFFGPSLRRYTSGTTPGTGVREGTQNLRDAPGADLPSTKQKTAEQSLAQLESSSKMTILDKVDVVLRRRNGKIFASIPQLRLYAKGDNVDAALAALESKKAALAAELEEVGEVDSLQVDILAAAGARTRLVQPAGDLGQFIVKTAVVAVAIAAVLVVSALFITSSVQQLVYSVQHTKIGGQQFWSRVEQELDRLASPQNDLPEAKKQKLLADIHAIAVKWRPFVVEVQSAFTGPDTPSTPPSAPPAPLNK